MFYISGFYKFKKIEYTKIKKNYLQKYFLEYSIRGTLIISKEGINGTLSSKKKNLNSAILKIKKIFNFNNFDSQNLSKNKFQPFHRAKVKIKKKLFLWELKF